VSSFLMAHQHIRTLTGLKTMIKETDNTDACNRPTCTSVADHTW